MDQHRGTAGTAYGGLPEARGQMGAGHRALSGMKDPTIHFWTSSDDVRLAYHELGKGRPVVLLHGLFSDARMNWIKFGHAERVAARGFRVIMPDLRAHGLSDWPHEPDRYPLGILARDLRELIA